MAVNPTNPNNLIATSIIDSFASTRTYTSTDGGAHWTKRLQNNGHGDPQVAFGVSGTAYHLDLNTSSGSGWTLQKSTNGGVDWTTAFTSTTKFDHPMMAVDPSSGTIYVAGKAPNSTNKLRVYVSTDGGSSFTDFTSNFTSGGPQITVQGIFVLSDGKVFLGVTGTPFNDNGTTYQVPYYRWLLTYSGGPPPSLVGIDAPATMFIVTRNRYNNAVGGQEEQYAYGRDTTGREVLYFLKADWSNPAVKPALKLMKSYSRGDANTWTTTAVVPGGPPDPYIADGEGQIMLTPSGTVGIAYLEATEELTTSCPGPPPHSQDHYKYDVYFTASVDDGASFLAPVKLNSALSVPDMTNCNNVQRPTGLDYMLAPVGSDGVFHAFWPDGRALQAASPGLYKLYTRTATVSD